jgi:hypothetical protein
MNKVFRITSFLMIALLFISVTSCNKDDDNIDGVGSGSVKITVNGKSYNFKNVTAAATAGILAIGGEEGSISMSFLLSSDIKEGEYDFNAEDANITALYTENNEGYFAESGSIKITSHNGNKIKATFHMTGKTLDGNKTVDITDGSFDVKYEEAK